ncbi:hypothetical protein MIR68_000692 [Amoeboaphelidium protococcarum]|nr:hypothetical protein MIR68_000692 [Amoeboaphelidium protococcarum]
MVNTQDQDLKVTFSGKEVTITSAQQTDKVQFNIQRDIKCIDFLTSRSLVAVGDDRGQILMYRFVSFTTKPQFLTRLHWHQQAVCALKFSADGNYLYSGGYERVLVRWHLDSGNKTFLPRLGSPIVDISENAADFTLSIVLLSNEQLVVDVANWELKDRRAGIAYQLARHEWNHPPLSQRQGEFIVAGGDVAVMNGIPGSLQFWSVARNEEVQTLAVRPLPPVHMNDDTGLVSTFNIQQVALTKNQSWLATVDSYRANGSARNEVSLKFWLKNSETSKYEQVSLILLPIDASVARVEFIQSDRLIVGLKSGVIKVFNVRERVFSSNRVVPQYKRFTWEQVAEFGYKGMSVNDLCVSDDGSLLAVAHDRAISLWSSVDFQLLSTIPQPVHAGDFAKLCFSSMQRRPDTFKRCYLMATCSSDDKVYVYDLLGRNKLVWTGKYCNVKSIVFDSDNTSFVFHHQRNGGCFICSVNVASWSINFDIKMENGVRGVGCARQKGSKTSKLIYMTSEYAFDGVQEEIEMLDDSDLAQMNISEGQREHLLKAYQKNEENGQDSRLKSKSVRGRGRVALQSSNSAKLRASHLLPSCKDLLLSFINENIK